MVGISTTDAYLITNDMKLNRFYLGIDYCLDNVWEDGWYAIINTSNVDIGAGAAGNSVVRYKFYWFYNNNYIRQQELTAFWEGKDGDNDVFRIIVDLWFNRVNDSSYFGGRINNVHYGKYATGWLWWTTYHDDITNATQSMCFENLVDSNGNIFSSRKLRLMKLWVKIEHNGTTGTQVRFRDFDLSEPRANDQVVEGVNTPIFVATKSIEMPQTGFLAPLYSIMAGLAQSITNAFVGTLFPVLQQIAAWGIQLVDNALAFTGNPHVMSDVLRSMYRDHMKKQKRIEEMCYALL